MAQTIINISTPNDGQGDPLRSAFNQVNDMFTELYDRSVFKVPGKGLSSNDFDDAAQTKLSEIEARAQKNVQSDLAQEDNTKNDFVKNKDFAFGERFAVQIEFYAGVSTFTLPLGAKVSQVLLVRAVLWELDEWTQTDNVLKITKTMNTGNRIQINFY